jgi:hypothetical protein
MRAQRGFTVVSLLFLLVAAGIVYSIFTFGPAYFDNLQVGTMLHEAANMCMHQTDDKVREFIDRKMNDRFDTGTFDERGNKVLTADYDPNQDVRIERTETPRSVDIWVNYQRHVPLPLIGGERVLTFNQHIEEDLSPVKW